jgi:hypothetical protein
MNCHVLNEIDGITLTKIFPPCSTVISFLEYIKRLCVGPWEILETMDFLALEIP